MSTATNARRQIKCLVWDLDHTLWDGVLLEDEKVRLRPRAREIIRTLDGRGILQSIASKNEPEPAMGQLRQFGIDEYFLYPQINWNAKSDSIRTLAKTLNLGLDSFAFVDDQPFERDEVRASLPMVTCLDASCLDAIPEMDEMNPRFITEDSKIRRLMYVQDIARTNAEQEFTGPKEEFLATLGMKFTISSAQEQDLMRAEELTVRTHQLNTTGYTYSYDELDYFRQSKKHRLLVADVTDKYGPYGKIGLSLIECGKEAWTIKLLLMSCRVMSRGLGTLLLNHIMGLAKAAGIPLRAEYIPNGRNRMMYVTYKFAGFKEVETHGQKVILESDCGHIQECPKYVELELLPGRTAAAGGGQAIP